MFYDEYDEYDEYAYSNCISDAGVEDLIDNILENTPQKQQSVIKKMLTNIFRSHLNYRNKFSYAFSGHDVASFLFYVVNDDNDIVTPLRIVFDYKNDIILVALELKNGSLLADSNDAYVVKLLFNLLKSDETVSMYKPTIIKDSNENVCWGTGLSFNNDENTIIDCIRLYKEIAEHSVLFKWISRASKDYYTYGFGSNCEESFLRTVEELNKEKSKLIDYLTNPSSLEKAQKELIRRESLRTDL